MHWRNITLFTLAIAMLISACFMIPPVAMWLNRWWPSRIFTLVSLSIAYVISGGSMPSEVVGWTTFVVWTLALWGGLLLVYAFWWEWHLINEGIRLLDEDVDATKAKTERQETDDDLVKIGRAIAQVETRRNRHWLLRDISQIDPQEMDEHVAARAISDASHERLVRRVLVHVEAKMAAPLNRPFAVESATVQPPGSAKDRFERLRNRARFIATSLPPVQRAARASQQPR